MKFLDLFKKIFVGLSMAITSVLGKINKSISDSNGKPKMGNSNFKKFAATAVIAFVGSMLVYNCTRQTDLDFKNIESYKRELSEDDGVRARKIEPEDPRVDRLTGSDFDSYGRLITKDGIETSLQNDGIIMSKTDCLSLLDRASKGEELSLEDREEVKLCADQNPMGWDESRLEAAKQSANPNISEDDKKSARDVLAGKAPERGTIADASKRLLEDEGKSRDSLKKAGLELSSEEAKILAKKIGDLEKSSQEAIKKAIASTAPAKIPSSNVEEIKGEISKEISKKENPEGDTGPEAINKDSIADNKKAIRKAVDDISDLNEKIRTAEEELIETQKQSQGAARNAANGKKLTEEEARMLSDLGKKITDVNNLKAEREKRKEEFMELRNEINELVGSVTLIEEEVLVGGFVDKKDLNKGPSEPVAEPQKANPKDAILGDDSGPKRVAKNERMKFTVDQAFISINSPDTSVSISPASKYLAVVGKIEVSSNQNGAQIRGVLMSNIYDSKSGKIVAPKRSILIAKAGGFSEETGKMDLVFDQIIVGSRKVDVRLRVGSADGTMGLSGDIYDTRNRRLLAAWIGSFMNGVTGWFSEAILREYENTKDTQQALLGAGLNGLKDISEKQTQLITGDLQNAPTIFRLPENTPVVLFPE